jgi:hypothetical protein
MTGSTIVEITIPPVKVDDLATLQQVIKNVVVINSMHGQPSVSICLDKRTNKCPEK